MILGIILCCLAALLPSLLLYLPNMAEIPFGDMLPYFGIMLAMGVLAWAVMYLVTRRRKGLAAFSAAVWLLAMLNAGRLYTVLHKAYLALGAKVFVPAALVFMIAVTFGLSRLKEEFLRDAVKVAALALAAVILSSAVMGIFTSAEPAETEEEAEAPRPAVDISAAEGTDRPNIYWILSDEYSGSDLLSKYYHYDNTPFYEWLRDRGFTVSEHSYNWHHDTYCIIQDIINFRYRKYNNKAKKLNVADANAPLWTVLRGLDYEIYEAESTDKFRLTNRMKIGFEDHAPRTAGGDAVANLLLKYSVFFPLENEILSVVAPSLSKKVGKNAILSVFEWAENPENLKSETPAFTVIYFQCPHAPYYFDRQGNDVPKSQMVNEKDKKYYLDQLIYTTAHLRKMCEAIQEADPDAVIVLQSDHGNRTTSNITKLDFTNVLNAVYFRGQPMEEIVDRNALNTWLAVLNRQFRLDLPAVEERRLENVYYKKAYDPEAEDPNAGLLNQ